MNWLYITSGVAVIFLIIGYICGNKVGHKQELDSKEINSARLSSEIQQKSSPFSNLTILSKNIKNLKEVLKTI